MVAHCNCAVASRVDAPTEPKIFVAANENTNIPNFWFLVPTGIKDLTLYPLGPTAVVLSWNRPNLGVFRKYVVEMFYFNPSTMTSEWTTYYEIAATVSLTASVVK